VVDFLWAVEMVHVVVSLVPMLRLVGLVLVMDFL
jgi:hypothetical protein